MKNDLAEWRRTEWVPSVVRVGNCGRAFLVTEAQDFCIEAKRKHPLLKEGTLVDIALLDEGELAVRLRE